MNLKKKNNNQVIYSSSYQLTKFQAPRLNSFLDILLTHLKCPNFQRAITPKLIKWFFKILSGNLFNIPYQLTKFQAPSSNVFEILRYMVDKFKMPKFSKGHNSEKI